MKKNEIKFSESGTSFTFIFASGSESLEISSKEEGFKAITNLASEKKITPEEFTAFRDQILGAEKLPWSENRKTKRRIPFPVIPALLGLAILSAVIDDEDESHDEEVKKACFRVCPNCGKHGKLILREEWSSSNLSTKAMAFCALEEARKRDLVTDEEFEEVKSQIEKSSLPVGEEEPVAQN